MTLLEAERVARRVVETLRQPTMEAHAEVVAQEYAEACASTARRLAQCSAMLLEGRDDRQGLQLAEMSPPLLDLITVLAFREAAEWRDYCQSHGLTPAESFDAKAIRRLNAAYSQGLNPDHRLYKEYRRAVQRGEDEKAVAVLRLIASLSPGDEQIAGDIRQLEDKILHQKLEQLGRAMHSGEAEAILAAILAIEILPDPPASDNEQWQQALQKRCELWLKKVPPLRSARAWRDASQWLDKVRASCARYLLKLPPAVEASLSDATTWVAEEKAAFQETAKFQRLLTDLTGLLASIDEKLASTRSSRADALQQDHETLGRKWRELEQFQRELPEPLAVRTSKTLYLLRAQIERKQKARRVFISAACAAVILLAAGVAIVLNTKRAARDFAAELKNFESTRQVGAAERLLAQVMQNYPRVTDESDARQAIEHARVFIESERQKVQVCKRESDYLAAQASRGFAEASLSQTQKHFDDVKQLNRDLAAEFQGTAEDQLTPSLIKWRQHVDGIRQEREREFKKQLAASKELAEERLKYEGGPAQVREALQREQPLVRSLESLTNTELPALAVSAELVQEYASLKRRMDYFQTELRQWDTISGSLQSPTSLEGHLLTLTNLQKSEFASVAQVRSAADISSMNVTPARLFAAVMEVEPGRDWTSRTLTLSPDRVAGPDRAKYGEVRDDPQFLTVTSCVLTQLNTVSGAIFGMQKAWIQGSLTTNKFGRPEGRIYTPSESPDTLNFRKLEFNPVEYRISTPTQTKESRLFDRMGLRDCFNAQGGYNVQLLVSLDLLNEDTEASPVLRAWLAMKLHSIIERNPNDWGEVWAPAVAAHRQQLRALGADRIKSEDWLVPAQARIFEKVMGDHFARARSVTYRKQALFFNKLARNVSDGGFEFVGYSDGDKKPTLRASVQNKGEWWGWDSESRSPKLLFRNGQLVAGRKPMAYSPLFAPRQQRAEWIKRAAAESGVRVGVDEAARPLPPLFSEPYE